MRHFAVWPALVFAMVACGGDNQRGESCEKDWPNDGPSGNCDSGLVCVSGVCRTECDRDADCPADCTCSHGALGVDSLGHCKGHENC